MQPETTQPDPAPAPEAARPVNRALVAQVKANLERLAGELEEIRAALVPLAPVVARIWRNAEILGDALGPRVSATALSGYAPRADDPALYSYDMQVFGGATAHASIERVGDPADRMWHGNAYVCNCRGICWSCTFGLHDMPRYAARRLMQRIGIELRVAYNHRSEQRRKAAARKDAARRAEILAAREEVAG